MSKISQKYCRKLGMVIVLAAGLLVTGAMIPSARSLAQSGGNPGVIPPNARPFGLSYGQWSARWWQFVFSIPEPDNPLLHDDKCSVGQSGPVWFLTGKYCVDQTCMQQNFLTATRSCTVPPGKALFFPIANAEVDNLGVDPPLTTEQLREFAKSLQDAVTSMSCDIDGAPVKGLTNSSAYRVLSPVFDYTIPDNSIYNAFGLNFPAQTVTGAVADGVFVMLAPLSAGQHTIHFTATFEGGFGFDITYFLTVGQ